MAMNREGSGSRSFLVSILYSYFKRDLNSLEPGDVFQMCFLLCLEDIVSLVSSMCTNSYNLSASSSTVFPEPEGNMCEFLIQQKVLQLGRNKPN